MQRLITRANREVRKGLAVELKKRFLATGRGKMALIQRTNQMEWTASPSPSVVRKRLELVGPVEAGRVTSVVKYLPESNFPKHEHPDGEEILVLDGVFSDATGDYPKGMYILNPEGFAHAPRSKDGCVLFVKLKQYPGLSRRKVRVDSSNPDSWENISDSVRVCPLYIPQSGEEHQETMELVSLVDSAEFRVPPQTKGAEVFVLEGSVSLSGPDSSHLEAGTWARFNSTEVDLTIKSTSPNSLLYLKKNHLESPEMVEQQVKL